MSDSTPRPPDESTEWGLTMLREISNYVRESKISEGVKTQWLAALKEAQQWKPQ